MPEDVTIGPDTPVRYLWPMVRKERGNAGTRAVNCLRRGRVHTVGELTGKTPLEVADIGQVGPLVLDEIRRALAVHGLSLRDDDGASLSDVAGRVHRLTAAGLSRPAALRFARGCWPKGEIAPGITLEVADGG